MPSPAAPHTPVCTRNPNGDLEWRLDGEFHRDDGPAVILADGSQKWYRHGQLHRVGGPAVEHADGFRAWHQNGKFHREDGPAVEWPDGKREWCWNGKYHRDGGPAIEHRDGTREWRMHGKQHREDGPAIEMPSGRRLFYLDGEQFNWALPTTLWCYAPARDALMRFRFAEMQQQTALKLLPTLPPELQRATVAEALTAQDADLRLWGVQATAVVRIPLTAHGPTTDAPFAPSSADPIAPPPAPHPTSPTPVPSATPRTSRRR